MLDDMGKLHRHFLPILSRNPKPIQTEVSHASCGKDESAKMRGDA